MRLIATLILIATLGATPLQAAGVFPASEWEQASPESQGVNADLMRKALAVLEGYCGDDGIRETVLIRNGYLIHKGDNIENSHNIWSSTKSFGSTILGLLVQDGVVTLEDRAADFEPLLREKYPDVTLRHFVTMTSGYNAVGDSRWKEISADWSKEPYLPADPLFAPGSAYCYWDEAMIMFGRVLTQILKEDLRDVLQRRIMAPIGINEFNWGSEGEIDGLPIRYANTNLTLSAEQFARFGLLFLNKGTWNGQQILSEDWIEQATRPQVPSTLELADTDRKNFDGRGVYGYNWWVNGRQADGALHMPNTPEGAYYASGLKNNVCFVIPEWNMVFVRMGTDGNPAEGKPFVYDQFFKELSKALER